MEIQQKYWFGQKNHRVEISEEKEDIQTYTYKYNPEHTPQHSQEQIKLYVKNILETSSSNSENLGRMFPNSKIFLFRTS